MFGFTDAFEIHEVTLEIYLEDKIVNRQTISAPKEMIMVSFVQTMNQIANDKRPMKIRMTRPEVIWDNFDKTQRVLTNEVSFSNNAMVSFEESKQAEQGGVQENESSEK